MEAPERERSEELWVQGVAVQPDPTAVVGARRLVSASESSARDQACTLVVRSPANATWIEREVSSSAFRDVWGRGVAGRTQGRGGLSRREDATARIGF